jgi:hypothetical protein
VPRKCFLFLFLFFFFFSILFSFFSILFFFFNSFFFFLSFFISRCIFLHYSVHIASIFLIFWLIFSRQSADDLPHCPFSLFLLIIYPRRYLARPETDAEIRALFEDLKVLNKKDYRLLLKWREKMAAADAAAKRARSGSGSGSDDGSGSDGSGSDDSLASSASSGAVLDAALAGARAEELRVAKRRRRALRKKRAKIQRRIDVKMILPGDYMERGVDEETFGLGLMRDGAEVEMVRGTTAGVAFSCLALFGLVWVWLVLLWLVLRWLVLRFCARGFVLFLAGWLLWLVRLGLVSLAAGAGLAFG